MEKQNIPSNKNFGITFSIFFLIVTFYIFINHEIFNIWLLSISLIFLILGIIDSKLLLPANKIWFKFGILLGKIVSPLVMGIIFFFVITPIGLILRVFKKDVLKLKFSSDKSYWIDKNGPESKMKNQY